MAVSITSQIFISVDCVIIAGWKWQSAVWSGPWTLPPEVQIRLHLPVGTVPHQGSPTHGTLTKGIIFENYDGKHIILRNRQVKNFVPNDNTSLIVSHALNNKTEENHLSPNFLIFKFAVVVISFDIYLTLPSADNIIICSFISLKEKYTFDLRARPHSLMTNVCGVA